MTDVAVAIDADRDPSPHRATQSSRARSMGSNGRRTGSLTPCTLANPVRASFVRLARMSLAWGG